MTKDSRIAESGIPAEHSAPVERTFTLDWVGGRLMCGDIIVAYLAGSCLSNPVIAAAAEALVACHKAYPRLIELLRYQVAHCKGNAEYGHGMSLTRVHGSCCGPASYLLRELGELK